MRRRFGGGGSIAALALATVWSSSGDAQAVSPDAATPPSSETRKATVNADEADVVVTGSRIARTTTDSPAPVQVLTAQQIKLAGQTEIADIINESPTVALTQTNQTSNLGGNAGINALDIRGLGTQRTLVLVDGHRHVAAMPGTSAVDTSVIPSSLVERVEILTGGASALYGADAVAGVANFILKKDYQGLEADVRYGNTTYGDFSDYSYSLLGGKNFADGRGNVTVYAFYERQPDRVSGQDRPWTAEPFPIYSHGPGTKIFTVQDGVRNIYAAANAQVLLGGNLYSFNGDGSLRAPVLGPGGIVNRTPVSLSDPYQLGNLLTDGGEYSGRYDDYYLLVPSNRFSTHGSANYAFSDALKLKLSLDFSHNESESDAAPYSSYGYDVVPGDSPYITDAMRQAAGNSLADGVNFARKFTQLGPAYSIYKRDMLQIGGDADGKFKVFGRNWSYSAYVGYGISQQSQQDFNGTALNRYYGAIDTTTGPNGQPICRSTLTSPGDGCVPINPFATLTPAQINYIQYNSSPGYSTLRQFDASAYVTGSLFDLPGGPAQIVAGGEYRRESQHIGAIPQYDPASPLYDPSIGTTVNPLSGAYDVKEEFTEVHLPLLNQRPFFHDLSIDAAARFSDYSTSGHTTTWKFGGEYAPVKDFRFRSTYGQAVRAPNISELYTQNSIYYQYLTDPCNSYNLANRIDKTQYTAANCATLNPTNAGTYYRYQPVVTQGNLSLKPEVAKTLTAGVVLQPRWLRNFTLTVDYWDIRIKGAIDTLGAQAILNHCVDSTTLNNSYCSFITRDSGNNFTSVLTENLNIAGYHTRGIDFELLYQFPLSGLGLGSRSGTVSIDSAYTRTMLRDFQLDPTDPTTITHTAGVFGTPGWKGLTRTTYSNGGFYLSYTLRHYGPMRPTTTITPQYYQPYKTPNVFYHDVSVSYAFNNHVTLYGGVQNALNTAPPRIPGAEAGGANFETGYTAGVYDVIGRMFWAGLTLRR